MFIEVVNVNTNVDPQSSTLLIEHILHKLLDEKVPNRTMISYSKGIWITSYCINKD